MFLLLDVAGKNVENNRIAFGHGDCDQMAGDPNAKAHEPEVQAETDDGDKGSVENGSQAQQPSTGLPPKGQRRSWLSLSQGWSGSSAAKPWLKLRHW